MNRFVWVGLVLSASACGAMSARKSPASPSYYQSSGSVVTTQAAGGQADSVQYAMAESTSSDDDGGGGGGGGGGSAQPQPPPSSVGQKGSEALVVEGWVRVEVEDVGKAADELRAEVARVNGRIVGEDVNGQTDGAWYGNVRIRMPPDQVMPFLDWLEEHGNIVQRRLQATDVSKTLFDHAIALENLELTLRRLQDLVGREGIQMVEVIALEREMERVRGEIERIKGESRYLHDRVAYATLDVALTRKADAVLGGPKAKFHPGPRGSFLILTDANGREGTRVGGGVTIHFDRSFTIDMDFFPDPGTSTTDEGTAVLLTAGGAAYSDFLGRGRRKFLNPYLGLRLGYGHMSDESLFIVAGDVGLELYKQKYVMVELFGRAMALIDGDGAESAIQTGAAVIVAF